MKIKEIIDNWDPYSLFPFAPKDEYSGEIEKIEILVKNNISLDNLSKSLESIFDSEDISKGKESFKDIAKKILENKAH